MSTKWPMLAFPSSDPFITITHRTTGMGWCQKLSWGTIPQIRKLNQKLLIFLFIHAGTSFNPSQMVRNENPQKRPSEPPNSANKEVNG